MREEREVQETSGAEAGGPGRRGLLRSGLGGAAALVAGAVATSGSAAAVTHYLDGRRSPTYRVAPRPDTPGLLGARVLFQGPPEQPRACITFDDGPDPRWTPMVLEILAQAGVKATFFVLGQAVQDHPGLLAQEVAQGHEIGVHNWVHTDVYGAEPDQVRADVQRTIEAVQAAGGPRPTLWRPPYGRVDAPALMVAAQMGLDLLLWSLNSPSAARAAQVAQLAGNGSVILCHDGRTQPTEALLEAMGQSLVALKAKGLEFVSGSEMLALPRA